MHRGSFFEMKTAPSSPDDEEIDDQNSSRNAPDNLGIHIQNKRSSYDQLSRTPLEQQMARASFSLTPEMKYDLSTPDDEEKDPQDDLEILSEYKQFYQTPLEAFFQNIIAAKPSAGARLNMRLTRQSEGDAAALATWRSDLEKLVLKSSEDKCEEKTEASLNPLPLGRQQYLLAVIYAMNGDTEKARSLFTKARENECSYLYARLDRAKFDLAVFSPSFTDYYREDHSLFSPPYFEEDNGDDPESLFWQAEKINYGSSQLAFSLFVLAAKAGHAIACFRVAHYLRSTSDLSLVSSGCSWIEALPDELKARFKNDASSTPTPDLLRSVAEAYGQLSLDRGCFYNLYYLAKERDWDAALTQRTRLASMSAEAGDFRAFTLSSFQSLFTHSTQAKLHWMQIFSAHGSDWMLTELGRYYQNSTGLSCDLTLLFSSDDLSDDMMFKAIQTKRPIILVRPGKIIIYGKQGDLPWTARSFSRSRSSSALTRSEADNLDFLNTTDRTIRFADISPSLMKTLRRGHTLSGEEDLQRALQCYQKVTNPKIDLIIPLNHLLHLTYQQDNVELFFLCYQELKKRINIYKANLFYSGMIDIISSMKNFYYDLYTLYWSLHHRTNSCFRYPILILLDKLFPVLTDHYSAESTHALLPFKSDFDQFAREVLNDKNAVLSSCFVEDTFSDLEPYFVPELRFPLSQYVSNRKGTKAVLDQYLPATISDLVLGYLPRSDEADPSRNEAIAKAFIKIHEALLNGESGFTWTRLPSSEHLQSLPAEDVLKIASDLAKRQGSRCQKALALAQLYHNYANDEAQYSQLFREIYKYSFAHSGFFGLFKRSKIGQETFYRSKSLDEYLDYHPSCFKKDCLKQRFGFFAPPYPASGPATVADEKAALENCKQYERSRKIYSALGG